MMRFLKINFFLILLIGLFYSLKKKKIDISVIIPIFNSEKFLSKCLNSVINQSLKTIEIICIDDGSTDNSLQILKELNDFDKRII
jgi:glycosyltransferase involved in cell wall biosynthesis